MIASPRQGGVGASEPLTSRGPGRTGRFMRGRHSTAKHTPDQARPSRWPRVRGYRAGITAAGALAAAVALSVLGVHTASADGGPSTTAAAVTTATSPASIAEASAGGDAGATSSAAAPAGDPSVSPAAGTPDRTPGATPTTGAAASPSPGQTLELVPIPLLPLTPRATPAGGAPTGGAGPAPADTPAGPSPRQTLELVPIPVETLTPGTAHPSPSPTG